ncbi:expressed protein [Chlorella variabilis]|uniref:Expressed protein n=1 Tax=Chlorella variabilis TaxID=554065 RepID=E1ZPG1_CHLVA|nr:expressed protein [Chlorella variabilis]EFN52271.1 expressed protein [Chlorella variabilis]|eukprot:XP_005844373.1 expressed protein [Chlorella variabilis]
MSATEPNEYEEARRRRMLRNEAVLQQLGLLENPMSGAAEQQRSQAAEQRRAARQWRQAAPAAPAGEQQVAAEPPRRSRRLQGEGAENAGANWGARPSEREQPRCARVWQPVQVDLAALEGGGSQELHAHNVMRVRSMSDRALQTRIWKIRRADKLHSFIKVLEACGKEELAAEAQQALEAMVGCGGGGGTAAA